MQLLIPLDDAIRYHSPRTNTATIAECKALAARLNILEVKSFAFNWQITKARYKAYQVVGKIWGDVVQECVVTLEPVAQQISEDFKVYAGSQAAINRLIEHSVLQDDDDTPEVIEDNTMDIADLAMQYFGLALDPYPRKADAAIPEELTPPPVNTVRLHIPLNPANDG